MIFELLSAWHRGRRYREISNRIVEAITIESQHRLDRTLVDAYARSTREGATEDDKKGFNQGAIERANDILSRENAKRVRQWTEAILDEEIKAATGQH